MVQFQITKRSKKIHQVMKNFRIVPYNEIEQTLDEATKKTFSGKKCEKFDVAEA